MVALPMLILLFGIISIGRTVYTYNCLSVVARDAARYAMVHGSKSASPVSSDDVQTFVRNRTAGLNSAGVTVSTNWSPNNNPGSAVQVQVNYTFYPLFPLANVSLPLSSSAQMVISY
jgi:Flp pilus assembly protein TadG